MNKFLIPTAAILVMALTGCKSTTPISKNEANEHLFLAIEKLDVNGAQKALESGADVNARMVRRHKDDIALAGWEPAPPATEEKDLFNHPAGFYWPRKNAFGLALLETASADSCESGIDLMKLLLTKGASKNAHGATPWECTDKSPMAAAVYLTAYSPHSQKQTENKRLLFDFLLSAGMSVAAPEGEASVLHFLAGDDQMESPEFIEYFIHHGAKVDAKTDSCFTKGAIPSTKPLNETNSLGYLSKEKILEGSGSPFDPKPIHFDIQPIHVAALCNNLVAVKALLKSGAKPDAKMADGDTPISIAERCGNKELAEYLKAQLKSTNP